MDGARSDALFLKHRDTEAQREGEGRQEGVGSGLFDE